MLKNTLIILFVLFTSHVFSQNNDSKTNTQSSSNIDKKNNTPKLLALDISKSNENDITLDKDTLIKPEIKLFAVDQINTNSKMNDSIIISKPELIPYTGYKKENEN